VERADASKHAAREEGFDAAEAARLSEVQERVVGYPAEQVNALHIGSW